MRNNENFQEKSNRSVLLFVMLVCTIVFFGTSTGLTIVVFAVEDAWFSDSFNLTSTSTQTLRNSYGLWRLCFRRNATCHSWFTTDGAYATLIEQRLRQSQAGINGWQALQIVFLFLLGSTFFILILALIASLISKKSQYYLSILSAFTAWPAAAAGITSLFVFGFSVYVPSTGPKDLEWCFYVSIAAVGLCFISSMLTTIHALLRKPQQQKPKNRTNILRTFPDFSDPAIILPPTQTTSPLSFEAHNRYQLETQSNENLTMSRPDTIRSQFHDPFSTTRRYRKHFEAVNNNFQNLDPRDTYYPPDYSPIPDRRSHYVPSSGGFEMHDDPNSSYFAPRMPMEFRNNLYRA